MQENTVSDRAFVALGWCARRDGGRGARGNLGKLVLGARVSWVLCEGGRVGPRVQLAGGQTHKIRELTPRHFKTLFVV